MKVESIAECSPWSMQNAPSTVDMHYAKIGLENQFWSFKVAVSHSRKYCIFVLYFVYFEHLRKIYLLSAESGTIHSHIYRSSD